MADEGLPEGVFPAPGKLRRAPNAERIAARVAKLADDGPATEGVMPVNAGFFQLERMRSASVAKTRAKKRAKARDR